MAYSINQMIVDGKQLVVALDWSYANAEGTLSNQHKLLEPYGSTPITEVTEEVAIGWLKDQLPNTSAEFDAAIAKRKSAAEYDKTLTHYAPHSAGPPTPITMPVSDEEIAAAVLPAGLKAKNQGL